MNVLAFVFASLVMFSCASPKEQASKSQSQQDQVDLSKYETAYFASGCFWCVEVVFESLKGVEEVISGYSGGHTKNPTYASSNTGRTGHAESNEVYYDPSVISFETLVDVYYASQNPTQVNGQGNDRGSQYRSIIFYKNDQEKAIAEKAKSELGASGRYDQPIATEIMKFEKFWIAEDYHQDYEKHNPNNPYIRGVSVPRFKRFKKKMPHLVKEGH